MKEDTSTGQVETRRLAAIMFTDMVGFSRQMGEDEARMLRLLDVHNQTIQQAVAAHHGLVIKTVGDAFLVDFPSVVHAVQCAQEIQSQFRTHNAEKTKNEQIHVRIGIHSGDIVQRDGDVFGDGVNIAARLQALTAPDTSCISDVVYRDVVKKLDLGMVVSLGRPKLKNIAERFWVYELLSEPPKGLRQRLRVQRLKLKPFSTSLATVGLLLIGGMLALLLFRIPHSPFHTSGEGTSLLPLPDKPSIVVLPFINMSGDAGQEYFSDGITEDLTSALSKLSGLFVISRNSAFTYKGKAVKAQEVSKELGVQYVLEGSVRKADGQVRITAQLIDATTDHHLWTARYDRPLKDIFALQDEITRKIVATLKLQLTLLAQGRLVRKATDDMEAYDFYLRGVEWVWRAWSERKKEANEQAQQMFEKAVKVDPQYAEAYALQSMTYTLGWLNGWNRTPQVLERWSEVVRKALALDTSLPVAHQSLAWLSLFERQHKHALAAAKRSIALDPNWAEGYLTLGSMLNFAGLPGESIEWIKQAMRLNPRYGPEYPLTLGWAYVIAGRYEEALVPLTQALPLIPNNLHNLQLHWGLVICYVELGREQEAQATAVEMLQINPQFSTEALRPFMPNKDPARTEHQLAALRKAGLK
jgi:adenylate cyclase